MEGGRPTCFRREHRGIVGLRGRLVPRRTAPGRLAASLAAHFQAKGCAVSSVSRDGLLRIPWPLTAADGTPVNVDVILGTATKAEATSPTSETIADAWLGQAERHERYFFENVRRGIRTADDGLIWRTIEERKPCWLRDDAYAEAIAILRREAVPAA